MLRALALLLLLANALLLAALMGWLAPVTGPGAATAQREPERLQRQVNPERVSVLSAEAASAALRAAEAAASAARAVDCLEAGPFSGAEAEVAERTLRDAGIGGGAWQAVRSEEPGAYMIYMGRYADRDQLQRKLEQIKRLRLDAEDLRDVPALRHGLSLGRFDSKGAADTAMARMVQRGLRTAKVITLRAPQSQVLLRVPAANATLRARLAGLRLPSGPGFVDCAASAAGLPTSQASAPASSSGPAASAASASTPASAPAPAPIPASAAANARAASASASR